MIKKRIPTACCNVGDVLAEDVLIKNGVTLVSKGTIINDFIRIKLIGMEVPEIYIIEKDDRSETEYQYIAVENNYFENIAAVKEILNDLTSGKKLNCEKVFDLSNSIYCGLDIGYQTIRCLNKVRSADEYTYSHCVNTAFYSMLIGKWFGLPDCEIKKLIQSGLLHDIGKSSIPSGILNKKGILTKEEYELIKKHTILGYEMVIDLEEIDQEVKRAVLLHHERVNCTGYPFNASPDCVGLCARIVGVADVFDAMTSERIYKKRSTPFEAFEMFKTVGIGIFDTDVLNVFLKNISTYYTGMKVLLSNGDTGEIAYVPPHDITNPIVVVNANYIDPAQQDIKILSML